LVLPEIDAKKKEDIQAFNTADRLKGKRALLVDDVEINRTIVASMLEGTGIEIEEADNGSKALEAFSASPERHYDIVYIDVQMPAMNGHEAALAIRALNRGDAKTVPIVALTANAFKDDIDKATASGMNSHLAKPINFDKLIETTFRLLDV
jgi:CheY-like chemotaxis protein